MLVLQNGWNPGADGANNRNGQCFFYDGATVRKQFAWGRMKAGSSGHGYGTVEGYSHAFQATLTQGNHLIVTAGTEFYLIGAQLLVFNIPDFVV